MGQYVLITGATGAVGPRVVHALHQAGSHVRTFSSDATESGVFPDNIETIIGDVTDLSAIQSAMCEVEAVIHLAALLHIENPPLELREKYECVNVGGTVSVIKAAIKAGVKRVVLFSTIAVYGQTGGEILNEDSPANPNTYYAKTKLAAEQIVLNAKRLDGQPLGTVLRLGAVYGSRIKGNYQRLVHALSRKRFIPIGRGRNRRTIVYDKDVARAAVIAMQHPAAAGKIYNVTDGQFHSVNEIIKAICQTLERKSPKLFLPLRPVKMAANLADGILGSLGISSPELKDALSKYCEDIAVDGSRIIQDLGFRPEYNLLEGWKETIQEMREKGYL
ncbi:MAG TPA: NAD-dependent epimerase/dehydratase family protein [Desulfosporosinus sp.]|nr:NAD-dependent epimerase/dehydratase family protein [Desulfosporosinus sp.]